MRALLFGVYTRAPDFRKLPNLLIKEFGLWPLSTGSLMVGSLGDSIFRELRSGLDVKCLKFSSLIRVSTWLFGPLEIIATLVLRYT